MVQDTAPSAVRIADPIDTIAPSALILIEVIAAVAAATIVAAIVAG